MDIRSFTATLVFCLLVNLEHKADSSHLQEQLMSILITLESAIMDRLALGCEQVTNSNSHMPTMGRTPIEMHWETNCRSKVKSTGQMRSRAKMDRG